jgi:hypothetical protein
MTGKRVRVAFVGAALVVLGACNPLQVDQSGVYTSTSPQHITGKVDVPAGETLNGVTVNGVAAMLSGNTYAADIPLDGTAVLNAVVVEAHVGSQTFRERRTVVYADGTHATLQPLDTKVPDATGLRFNDSALAKLAPAISAATPVTPADVVATGTVLYHAGCPSLPCPSTFIHAQVSGPPTLGARTAKVDGQTFLLAGEVGVADVQIPVHTSVKIGGSFSQCDGTMSFSQLRATGTYLVGPDPADGDAVDVNQAAALTADATNPTFDEACLGPFAFNTSSADQMVGVVEQASATGLGDPDGTGPGDAKLADGIESVLTGLTSHGPLAGADAISVDSAHSSARIDAGGLVLELDTGYAADSFAPGAPDLHNSLSWGEALPLVSNTTPHGLPFDYAVGGSVSSLDQLLAADTERGRWNAEVDDPGIGDALGLGPVRLRLRPEIAPVLRPDQPGAAAFGELAFRGYRMTFVGEADGLTKLDVVLDVDTLVELKQRSGGELGFDVALPDPAATAVTVTYNPAKLSTSTVASTVRDAIQGVFFQLPRTLPAFPVPGVTGTDQQLVEVARFGPNFVLYTSLVPTP